MSPVRKICAAVLISISLVPLLAAKNPYIGYRGFIDNQSPYWKYLPQSVREDPTTQVLRFEGGVSEEQLLLKTSFYLEHSLSTNKSRLKSGDAVCVGDRIREDSIAVNGEWDVAGGFYDTPPVDWVKDIDNPGKITTHNIVTRAPLPTNNPRVRLRTEAAVLCEKDCQVKRGDNLKQVNSNVFEVKQTGNVEISSSCQLKCKVKYKFKHLGKWITFPFPYSLNQSYSLKAKTREGKRLKVASVNLLSQVSEPFNVRLEIVNQEDSVIKLRDIDSNLPSLEVLYAPDSLEPGESSEILLEGRLDGNIDAEVDLKLYSKNLGCKDAKTATKTVSLGWIKRKGLEKCGSDADCSEDQTCCLGRCHKTLKGTCDDVDGDGRREWVYY